MSTPPDLDVIIADVRNSIWTKRVGIIAYTVLLWDHALTFADEVEYIWKGGKGLAIYLFFLIRYLVPLSFMVNLWAYFRTTWNTQSCAHFVKYEGAWTMIGISVVEIMMFIRISALYASYPRAKAWAIYAFVLLILTAFIGVNTYLMIHGVPVQHKAFPLVDSCTMITDLKVPHLLASSTAWLPLAYDTVIVFLTIARTAQSIKSRNASQILRVLLQEGLLFYGVICSITIFFTIFIFRADQTVRNIAGQLHLCITVAMMARITIHLKQFAHRPSGVIHHEAPPKLSPTGHQRFHSSDPLLSTVTAPTYAPSPTAHGTSSLIDTFMSVHGGNEPPVRTTSEDESYFPMGTFSTGTEIGKTPVGEFDDPQHTRHFMA